MVFQFKKSIMVLLPILEALSITALDAQDLRLKPPIQQTDSNSRSNATSSDEILSGNPIKLTITKDELSSDLPMIDKPLSLDDAVKVGLKHNLEFLAAKEQWSGSKYLARAALARFGPQASMSLFYSNSSLDQMLFYMDREISPAPMQPIVRGNAMHALFAGYQPLFTGGRLMGGYKQARAIERQSLANYRSDRIKAALKVKESYWKAAWDLANLQVKEDYTKYRKWSTDLMKARYDQGKVNRAELLREQAELAKAQQLVNTGYRDYNSSLLELKVAMGLSVGSQISLKDELRFQRVLSNFQHFLKEAQISRPELMQADARVHEAEAKYMQARSKYLPQMGLYGVTTNATGKTPGIDGSVEGRWGGTLAVQGGVTLFDSGKRLNELLSAKAEVRKAAIEKKGVQLNVAKDVSQAWIDLDMAGRNVSLAEEELVSAKEDERLFHKRYQVGKAIELDYFLSGVKYFDARLRLLEAIYKYRIAEAQLIWASGNV